MVAHCAEHGWPREHGSAEHCVNYFSAASAEARVHMFWYKVEKWEIYRAQPDKHPMEVEYGEAFVDAHVPAMEMAGKARTHINERYPDDATDDDLDLCFLDVFEGWRGWADMLVTQSEKSIAAFSFTNARDDDPVTPEEFARIIARSERIRYGLPLMAEKMFGRIH